MASVRPIDADAADQLTRIATTSGTTLEAFGYDGAGRRTTHAAGPTTTDYGYDALGRLTTVSTPDTGHALALFYDAQGARTRRTETSHPQALFLGGWIESRDGVKNRLLRAPGASGPLAEIPPAGVQTLHRDGSGNVTKIGQAGAAISTRRYNVFGTLRSGAESPIERGYAGLPREGASGLRYAGARYYDPSTGRFLQPDPAGLYQPNLYAYAANNPIVYADPSGLAAGKLSFSGFPDWLSGGFQTEFDVDPAVFGPSPWNVLDQFSGVEKWQLGFTLAGLGLAASGFGDIPGAVVDAASGVLSLSQGEWGDAMWAAGSAVPIAGAGANLMRGARATERVEEAASSMIRLAEPGEDLFVGFYGQSRRANLRSGMSSTHTPHHVVQDAASGTSRSLGATINLRKDLHALTRTFGRNADLGSNTRNLAADIWDLRSVLRGEGYDRSLVNQQLRRLIELNRQSGNVP